MTSIPKKPNTPTSSKPHVMVLEGLNGNVRQDPHAWDVGRSAKEVLGVNSFLSPRQMTLPETNLPNSNSIEGHIENSYMTYLNNFSNDLVAISKLPSDKRPNAVNFSVGYSEFNLLESMSIKPNDFYDKATQTEKTSLFDLQKKAEATKYVWKLPELESYIDTTLDKSPKITEAKKKTEDAVEALKQKNVAVVVAVGNMNDKIEAFKKEHPDVQFEPDEGQNIYAVKNAITVGASNPDGTRTKYSSRGAEVDITTQVPSSINRTGTSFTAPVVAGMVAFLIAQGYTVDEAKDLLKNWGTAKQDEFGNSYTDLNLETVQKKLAQFNKPASKEKKKSA